MVLCVSLLLVWVGFVFMTFTFVLGYCDACLLYLMFPRDLAGGFWGPFSC